MEIDVNDIKKFVKRRINFQKKKNLPAKKLTIEELISVLRRVGGTNRISEKDYNKKRDKGDPNSLTFHRRFGSWNMACEVIWGKLPIEMMPQEYDELYFVKLVNEYDIRSIQQYDEKRKKYPELFPSKKRVTNLFKNFTNLFAAAKKYSLDKQILECLKLKNRLGRFPTIQEYSLNGVNMTMLLSKYVTLANINKLIRLLEEGAKNEIAKRNKIENAEYDGQTDKRSEKKMFKSFADQLHS